MKHKWTACLLALMLEIVAATGCANTDEDVSARLNENGQEEQFIGEPEPVPEPEPEPVPEPVPEPEP